MSQTPAVDKILADYAAYAERYETKGNFGIVVGHRQFREALAEAWQAGREALALATLPGAERLTNPYEDGAA